MATKYRKGQWIRVIRKESFDNPELVKFGEYQIESASNSTRLVHIMISKERAWYPVSFDQIEPVTKKSSNVSKIDFKRGEGWTYVISSGLKREALFDQTAAILRECNTRGGLIEVDFNMGKYRILNKGE